MNILNGGYLSRYAPVVSRTIPASSTGVKLKIAENTSTELKTQLDNSQGTLKRAPILSNNFHLPVNLYWTQVRYHKHSPPTKLHSDIKFPNFDAYRKKDYIDTKKTTWYSGDGKAGITYVMGFFGYLCGYYGYKAVLHHYVWFMATPADVLAMASVEVDISKVAPGGCMAYKWRGKPLFIKNRTEADIELEAKTPLTMLRDPETPEQRTIKPEWLVVVGICTHLGCVPIPNSGDWSGGFYCPCHGSHYDNVGRARKGPAPTNLEVPPYKFLSDTVIVVG